MNDSTRDLRIYKRLPEWTAATLPEGFRRKHNTKEGTWAQLTVLDGSLRFIHLDEHGEVVSSEIIDAAARPLLVPPGAWHRVEPVDDTLRCQLAFLCDPSLYLQKKHGLTAPHSEVRALLPQLEATSGRRVLDLGSGRGRNSVFLAQRGFTVEAVDRSETAIEALRRVQSAEGVAVTSTVYDINRAALADVLESRVVDHVVCTVVFQFLERARVDAIIGDMQSVTRDGGLHLIVAPLTSAELPCPLDFPTVFERGELREHYRDWDLLRYDESRGEFHKRDGNGERYKAEFATLVARRSAP